MLFSRYLMRCSLDWVTEVIHITFPCGFYCKFWKILPNSKNLFEGGEFSRSPYHTREESLDRNSVIGYGDWWLVAAFFALLKTLRWMSPNGWQENTQLMYTIDHIIFSELLLKT